MQDFSIQSVGEIVERLIYIKDNYDIKDRGNLEAINNACIILSHRLNKSDVANILINEYIADIHWQEVDIKMALEQEGFEPSDENVLIILDKNPSLGEDLEDRGIEAGWEVIHYAIHECKGKLTLRKE